MPRVSRQQTAANRATIEEVSARLFREQGFKAVSVNDLMGAAGLTHGGFYGHFASKDALLAAACEKAFADSTARWSARADRADAGDAAKCAATKSADAATTTSIDAIDAIDAAKSTVASAATTSRAATDRGVARALFDELAANYLSPASRANAGAGCPAATLAADVARECAGAPVRAAYVAGTKQLLAQLARISDGADAGARDAQAMLSLATMVGALTLARATDGDPVSDAILAAALAALRAH